MKPRRRPHYRGTERLRILELKAARGWSNAQAADRFFLGPATIAEWTKRVDEEGEGELLGTPEPINRFPDFVRHIVTRLKVLCPTMGKKRIAQTLARAGLALGVSTVGRILKERESQKPEPNQTTGCENSETATKKGQPVQAKEPRCPSQHSVLLNADDRRVPLVDVLSKARIHPKLHAFDHEGVAFEAVARMIGL